MDTNNSVAVSLGNSWRWIVATYCYLVLFHLLPTFLMGGLILPHLSTPGGSRVHAIDPASVWLILGVAVVAFVVGYRSKGFTIIEPAIAGVLYAFTTAAGFRHVFTVNVHDRAALAALFWLLIVVILTVASAWVGEVVQQRRSKRS
jgi:hypothetical protein